MYMWEEDVEDHDLEELLEGDEIVGIVAKYVLGWGT